MFDIILARVSKYIIGCEFTYQDVLFINTYIQLYIPNSHTRSFQLTIKINI